MPIDMAQYMQERRAQRRLLLRTMLGEKCVDCESTEAIEFDHRDPSEKAFTIASGLDGEWDTLVEEVKKCELRCRPCHIVRSVELGHLGVRGEANGMWVEARHGTLKMYQTEGCKCDECREFKRMYRNKLVDSQGQPR